MGAIKQMKNFLARNVFDKLIRDPNSSTEHFDHAVHVMCAAWSEDACSLGCHRLPGSLLRKQLCFCCFPIFGRNSTDLTKTSEMWLPSVLE